MEKVELLNKIDAIFRDDFNGEITGSKLHEVLTDIANSAGDGNGIRSVIPEGKIVTVPENFQYPIRGKLSVAGKFIVEGKLIIN